MSKQTLPYQETGYFSQLMSDYLSKDESLAAFYGRFPTLENFKAQIQEKRLSVSTDSRTALVTQLNQQYAGTAVSGATQANIDSLSSENTFTITTGHQLNLFSGPLYFLYKIFSVINLSETLNKKYIKQHFVPIYWMATEDHDFDEINFFNSFGTKYRWDRKSEGAVGELSTDGLDEVLKQFQKDLGESDNAKVLSNLFSEAYLKNHNLADATRYLGNELFKTYGLVIIDGNDAELKKAFVPFVKKEFDTQLAHAKVTEATSRLTALGYPEQVHPREINLFYLTEGSRERIIEKEGKFFINNSQKVFSGTEIHQELNEYPERFSPNVLLRPLYQEVILPNLCYIGGGGELAYWLQLKTYFESVKIPFPVLLLRNSVLLAPLTYFRKLEKLGLKMSDLFQKQEALKASFTKRISEIPIDFSNQKAHLKEQFEALYKLASQTDASFKGAVGAQEKKQLNGLDYLEKRLLKAQKRKFAAQLNALEVIQNGLFPKQSLQERTLNFSQFYVAYGDVLLSKLKENLDPLDPTFTILELA
ncbi:MAG: bacillithiol biosynthesis cysteine-adding enzyme BshC [Candidatus Latescibacterota bacterium]|jgi:bacillithiol biosynthesis cysteine-adding enzyme BshC